MSRGLLLLCLVAALAAGEWRVSARPDAVGVQAIPPAALAQAVALRVEAERATAAEADAWVEVRLLAADGRRYACAAPLHLEKGERRTAALIALDGASWSGRDGPLGADAVRAMWAIEIAVHGWDGAVQAKVTVVEAGSAAPAFTVSDLHGGLVEVGPWREWRLRLAGSPRGELGEVEIIDAAGRAWPLFLDQPGQPDAGGRWRACGPARWVLRRAPGELPFFPVRVHWSWRDEKWSSPELTPAAATVARQALPSPAPYVLPLPVAEAWAGPAATFGAGGWTQVPWHEQPAGLAPVISWRMGWTGFRGGGAMSWPQAVLLDHAAAAGLTTIDLLPEGLGEEQGPFRFGLSPWTGGDGPWRTPRDLWRDDGPWQEWRGHARAVVARCRAAPGLASWSLGLLRSANDDRQRERLGAVAGGLAALVARYDRRPLIARQPQLVGFARRDPQGAWFDFRSGVSGWTQGPPPLLGPVQHLQQGGSDGNGCIAVPIASGGEVRVAGAQVAVDASLFNLERIEADVALDGGGEATLFAWFTDHHHRWWQTRLERIPGDGGWQTIGIPCDARAAWGGSADGWSDDVRRRIRAFGLVAYVRGADAQARLRIDRVRRFGWPARSGEPALAIAALTGGEGRLGRWQPITASFQLSLPAANPYDPDQADVIGEAEGPGGVRVRHPAFWSEPYSLDFDGQAERALPAGPGGWRWRFTPSIPGTWRWRIVARLKDREAWRQAESPWRTTVVDERPAGLLPVGPDARDPRWFAKTDGSLWYPIGINLRSPGDGRQDQLLDRERAMTPTEDEPAAVRGWRSRDWERLGTRAYERWFPLLHANGMDWARVWMCSWWCGLEWRRDWGDYGGLGWYSQGNAARMDRLVELAEANGVYLQVELMNHGMVSDHVDQEWSHSPYNARNGGPCRNIEEWFGSEAVWRHHSNRLRYTLARWGHSTAIAAFSLCSEMEFSGTFDRETGRYDRGHSPTIQTWIERSLAWMREHDPQPGRMVTIHWSKPWSGPQHWQTAGLGFSNSNAYTGFQDMYDLLGNRKGQRSLPNALDAYIGDIFPPDRFRRPTLLGEWGGHWSDNQPWVLRGELRSGVWLQAVLPYAANTGFWWWLWLDTTDQWRQYAAVARFMQGEERRGIDWQRFSAPVDGTGGRLLAMGMRSERAVRLYVWPRGFDQDHRRKQVQAAGTVVIDGRAPDSRWRVRRYDGGTGQEVAGMDLAADGNGVLHLGVGGLDPDAVFKLDRIDQGRPQEPETSSPPGR